MNSSGIDGSSTSPRTLSTGSDQSPYNSSDGSNRWKCHSQKFTDSDSQLCSEDLKQFRKTFSDALKWQGGSDLSSMEPPWNQHDSLALHRGLEAIASSLSILTNTLGMALEERRHNVESKASDRMCEGPQASPSHQIKSPENRISERHLDSPAKPQVMKNKQMKAPQEVAIAMTTKAKLILRELKCVKQDLLSTKERCAQLEDENRRLRDCIDKGVREEDDLVRLQLEALLAEKARLSQENASYARENQFLHEVVQYHQLKLRELAISDESLTVMDEELDFDEEGVAMDLMPIYPPDDNAFPTENVVGEPSEWQEEATCAPSQEV